MTICGISFGVMGLAVSALAGIVHLMHGRLRREGLRAEGLARAVSDEDDDVKLVVTFADETGALHTVKSQGANTGWLSKDGRKLAVLYYLGRPEKARIEADLTFQTRLGLILGSIFAAVGGTLIALSQLRPA